MNEREKQHLVEEARRACVRAASEAYEDAGLAGLCHEGRWEAALDAMRTVDLTPHVPTDESRRAAGDGSAKENAAGDGGLRRSVSGGSTPE